LRNIFGKTTDKIFGLSKLVRWHEKVNQSGFKSSNAKIKAFRAQFRGVRNVAFFFRLT
jgi:hypothetical protein